MDTPDPIWIILCNTAECTVSDNPDRRWWWIGSIAILSGCELYVMWKNKWLPRLRKRAAAMVSYCDMTREGESRSGGLKIDEPVLEYISTEMYAGSVTIAVAAGGRRIERVNVVSIIRQEIGRQPYVSKAPAGAAPLESEELVEELYQADSIAFGEAMFDALLHGDDNTQYYPDWVGICRSAFMGDTGHIYGNCEMWVDFDFVEDVG